MIGTRLIVMCCSIVGCLLMCSTGYCDYQQTPSKPLFETEVEWREFEHKVDGFLKEYVGVQFGDSADKFSTNKFEVCTIDVAKKYGRFDKARLSFKDGKISTVYLYAHLSKGENLSVYDCGCNKDIHQLATNLGLNKDVFHWLYVNGSLWSGSKYKIWMNSSRLLKLAPPRSVCGLYFSNNINKSKDIVSKAEMNHSLRLMREEEMTAASKKSLLNRQKRNGFESSSNTVSKIAGVAEDKFWEEFNALFSMKQIVEKKHKVESKSNNRVASWYSPPYLKDGKKIMTPPDIRVGDSTENMPRGIYTVITNRLGHFYLNLVSVMGRGYYDGLCITTSGYVDPKEDIAGTKTNNVPIRTMYDSFKKSLDGLEINRTMNQKGALKNGCIDVHEMEVGPNLIHGEYVRYEYNDGRIIGMSITYPSDRPLDDEATNLQINIKPRARRLGAK